MDSIRSRIIYTFRRLSVSPLPKRNYNTTHPMSNVTRALSRTADRNAVMMVMGASRGIGFALVKKLLSSTKGRVFAACRDPTSAKDLRALESRETRLKVCPVGVDLRDMKSIEDITQYIGGETENRLDMMINTVGILHEGDRTPERALKHLDAEWLQQNLQVNTIGPIMLMKHFAPLLRTKGRKDRPISVAATLSARVGSISDNNLGGWYSYRISKAALNMGIRTCSLELARQGTRVLALHPGTVTTDLSAPFRGNVSKSKLLLPEDSAEKLLHVIDTRGDDVPKLSGGELVDGVDPSHEFYDFNGKPVFW